MSDLEYLVDHDVLEAIFKSQVEPPEHLKKAMVECQSS